MQPIEAHNGFSTKSKLYDSLKVYLNNKDRLQPIIGLGSIIECVKAGANYREALYLCEVCACRLSKADIRNHIMGSLHRYNYIKAWHPHLVSEWKENTDLSKLAWPLMEKAKILEGKEGPGDVQLLEVEDTIYQKMATCSENDAATLINILSHGQGEPESHSEATSVQLEHNPIQSHRIVLLAKNQQKHSQTSAETNKAPSLIQSTVAPSVTSEGWVNNMSLLDNSQMLPETSVLSDNNKSFLDGYMGTKPLIGLFRVVECRSEDGHTYCFLCHCCRVRSNKKDIIDHLTSSSHLVNYLMETHPEQMEVLMADVNDNYQLLQSLAKKVEQEEDRGELKVVNAPESLCILLTGKSYHWCVKMLCNGWTHTNIHKRKIAVKVPSVTNQRMPEKCAAVLSERTKRMTTKRKMRKMRKMSNTVFKVSLPINKGSVLLERTSFSVDSLPVSSAYSPPPEDDVIPSPESQSEDCELDCGTGSLAVNDAEHTSPVPQDQYSVDEDADAGQYMGSERNFDNHYQEMDGNFSHNEYLNQPETEDPRLYGENNYNGSEFWAFYNSFYGCEEGCTEQWYNSSSQSKVGTGVDVPREEGQKEMSSGATQNDYQQQPQDQYTAQDHASLLTGTVGQHGFSGESAHVDVAWINMHPHLGYSIAHSGNITPGVQFPKVQQRQWPTYMGFIPFPSTGHVQTAPQRYMTQPTAHQAIQVGHGVMSNPNCNTGPTPTPEQHFPHPSVIWNPR
ncbi:uncharacterized protein LOC127358162 [Dicentrarchus labrax]|uniref:uncharacterized protein LOC127358162 n=1 Tax=Dicentrarchus labrax TaxID=13489 RepID=UPI0021F562A6|nr:uncharacterized protein LOC127358162 [Dicentrarchus labrax]